MTIFRPWNGWTECPYSAIKGVVGYLAGYTLRTCAPAVTCSRLSRKAAVKDPAPTNDIMPTFRLPDKILAKLFAIALFPQFLRGRDGWMECEPWWCYESKRKGGKSERIRWVRLEEETDAWSECWWIQVNAATDEAARLGYTAFAEVRVHFTPPFRTLSIPIHASLLNPMDSS